jgi:hypothetical protein
VIIFTAFHSSSVSLHSNREADHDTDEADKRSRQFGSLFPAEEFE